MDRTLIIAGPSQVGKSVTIKELVNRYDYNFITTYTTRAPRDEEIDGQDYYFLTEERFQELIVNNEFMDWDYFLSSYGGIGRQSFLQRCERPKVLHVLARMALRLEQRNPGVRAVFLAPEDTHVAFSRIRARFKDPLVVSARCAHVDEEMLHSKMFRTVVRVSSSMSVAEVAREVDSCWTI